MTRSSDGFTPREVVPDEVIDGRYRLVSLIGRGGMGAVYRALDMRLQRAVALKLLTDGAAADDQRFRSEVETLARFAHPNLVRLLDAGESDGRLFLVMDLIEGATLATRIAGGPLSLEATRRLGADIASALSYVHRRGVVHRDIKPANILLDEDGVARLADFGIARLVDTTGMTMTGLVLGTPAYLAPEQVVGKPVGPAVDVYAFGLVLLECLTGRRAFHGTASEVTAARLHRGPEIPSFLDRDWQSLLRSMTASDPRARASARTVLARLSQRPDAAATVALGLRGIDDTAVLDQKGPTERLGVGDGTKVMIPTSTRSRANRRSRARAIWLATTAVVLAGLVGGLVLGGVFSASDKVPRASITEASSRSTTASSSTSTSSTTTTSTTTTSTTTTTPVESPSVTATKGLVQAIESAMQDGAIAMPAGEQLVSQLQPLLASDPGPPGQQVQQFDTAAQTLESDIAEGAVTGATSAVLTADVQQLASALGTTVPTTIPSTAPSPPGPAGPGDTGDTGDTGNANSFGYGIGHRGGRHD